MNGDAKKLLNYHFWANKTLLNHLRTLPQEVFTRHAQSVFPSIAQTFDHMFSADDLWLTRLQGTSRTQFRTFSLRNLDMAHKDCKHLADRFTHFIQNESDISRMIAYQNTKGDPFHQTIMEIIQHVVNHGTYHRGNIAAMIRQFGFKGTSTDYITFLRAQN